MIKTMKQGALALALLSSVALFAAPAVANSLHDEGDFGGGILVNRSPQVDLSGTTISGTIPSAPIITVGSIPMATPAITMAPAFPCGVRAL